MFFDVTQRKKEIEDEILALVGKPLSLWDRIKVAGSGSQRFQLVAGNDSLLALAESSSSMQFCNIELRTSGVVIWFRIKLENYLIAIPFHMLTLLKSDGLLRIYGGEWKLVLAPAHNAKLDSKFITKMLKMKAEYLEESGANSV